MNIFLKQNTTAIRTVDLSQPLADLADVHDYNHVRILVKQAGVSLGSIDIANYRQPIRATRLRQAIVDNFALELLASDGDLSKNAVWASAVATLAEHYLPLESEPALSPANWLVDLSQPLPELIDGSDSPSFRVMVTWKNCPLGDIDLATYGQPVSREHLRTAIVDHFGLKLLDLGRDLGEGLRWAKAIDTLARHYRPDEQKTITTPTGLPAHISVSIVLATFDRPDDLRNCLRSLTAQVSPRHIEIIVVDNNPDSGLTAPVVTEFPGVVVVNERRKGLSYARNAGVVVSRGDIVVMTDDDVIVPEDWIEKLVAPFARKDVMVVTGNVLPKELENTAQHLFETYGGLGRGFQPFEAGGDWFESFVPYAVPTWNLGATANAAFRTVIFSHPQIGLLDEALGAGTPTGCSEDTYLFYQVLKAGYTIVYEPTAYVWHKHRQDMPAFRRQIYNYSKGHVAYHLTTLLRDYDLRALWRLIVELPKSHVWRTQEWLRGRSDYPLSLTLLEIKGHLVGPWALWRSRRRVKREGRSSPYLPVSQRAI